MTAVSCPGCSRRYDIPAVPPGRTATCRCGTRFDPATGLPAGVVIETYRPPAPPAKPNAIPPVHEWKGKATRGLWFCWSLMLLLDLVWVPPLVVAWVAAAEPAHSPWVARDEVLLFVVKAAAVASDAILRGLAIIGVAKAMRQAYEPFAHWLFAIAFLGSLGLGAYLISRPAPPR